MGADADSTTRYRAVEIPVIDQGQACDHPGALAVQRCVKAAIGRGAVQPPGDADGERREERQEVELPLARRQREEEDAEQDGGEK